MRRPPSRTEVILTATAAIGIPAALTAILLHSGGGQPREYVFLYLAVVAGLGVTRGLWPAILAATSSFLLVDWYFIEPVHTLSFADGQDLVNLAVFYGAAALVGELGSRRRQAQISTEALARELRRANAELERLNREQAEAAAVAVRLARTEQQVRALTESDRVRREFLATVSHELRTPLAGILTLSTALAAKDDVTGGIRHDLSSIAGRARRIDRLVADMLDMARIEGSTLDLHLETVAVDQAVDAAVDRLRQTAPSRVVERDVDADLTVVADWDRFGQVLDNLFGNAVRFSPPDTPITVRAERGARHMVVVRVVDRGPGIPPEVREHAFERFVRGPQRDGAGTGLGLAIVRGLVEAQAGRVWIDDLEDGVGTCIALTLPAAPAG